MPAPKKIRGKRRRFAWLQQRFQYAAAELNLTTLQHWHYVHDQLGLGPWHWHQRQPPRVVRQLAVQHLLATFFAWQKQLHNSLSLITWRFGWFRPISRTAPRW